MDDRAFADALCAWVDPAAVLHVARTHASSDPGRADDRGHLRLSGSVPDGPRAIGLDTLVGKFLRGFQMPAEYVAMLAARFSDVPRPAWDFALGLRCDGQVMFGLDAGDENTILLLNDRASFVRLVAAPLDFLVRHTLNTARNWSADAGQRREFLEHSVYSDWLVFLEYTVAAALGAKDLATSAQRHADAQVLYGDGTMGLSVVSEPPFPDPAPRREAFEMLYRGAAERWRAQRGDAAPAAPERIPFDFATPVAAGQHSLSAADGFLEITEADATQPWRNVSRWRNECSPYALLRSQRKTPALSIDTYYGRVFEFPLEENVGIYGITDAMPDMPWSSGHGGYLRSPYRKVPCYTVKDLAELQAVLTYPVAGDGAHILFRGQSKEYRLDRSPNARHVLYGDADAIEPSLLATSTRNTQPLEAVMPAWVLLVRTFLLELWSSQLSMPDLDPRARPIIEEDAQRVMTGLDLHLYAISLAQHYGLPTMGLDVTADLSVALFFALHKSRRNGRNIAFDRKGVGDPPSVLYAFAPDQRYQLNHEQAKPRTTGEGRPERQGARFLVTGWGHHRNSAARHLALAMYLDPAGDFGPLPSARQIFPARQQDLFGDFLERSLEQGLPAELTKYVEQLYWVVDE